MSTILEKTYKGKKVLITGHTGFKGSWLSIWLTELGAQVVGYSLAPATQKDNYVLSNIKDKIVDIRGDVRDREHLFNVFKEHKPDIVFHLAAQPIVSTSYKNPHDTYEINIMGTVNILDAVRTFDNTKVGIIITSDKCYENREWVWGYRENDPMGGYDPYSASKGCAELVVSSYVRSFFNPLTYNDHGKAVASVRAGNVIGGGDWSLNRIIPDCVRAVEGNEVIILRNPKAVRPWQHVLEPLSGYLLLGSNIIQDGAQYSGAWNFGPNQDSIITVEEVVKILIKEWGKGSWDYAENKNTTMHEAGLLNLDISKARHYLKWSPKWSISKTIEKTIEWYRNYNTHDVYNICASQISEYCNYKL